MSFFALILKNLRRRPARSLLTVVGIAIGICAVVALSSLAWGFEHTWENTYKARGIDLVVAKPASHSGMPGLFPETIKGDLQRLPHVREATGILADLFSVEDSTGILIAGWEERSFLWDHLTLQQGRWPDESTGKAVAMGTLAAETLGKSLGSKVQLETAEFTVVGVFSSPALAENSAIIMKLSEMQALTDSEGRVNFLEARLAPGTTPAELESLRLRIRNDFKGLTAFAPREVPQADVGIRLAKAMSLATSFIALIVGATGVANTILMSVFERVQEIGILLAIGWRRTYILGMILLESVLLSCGGGVVGCVLGIVTVKMLQVVPFIHGKIAGEISWSLIGIAFLVALLLGVLGGLYPAWIASRMSPTTALRHE